MQHAPRQLRLLALLLATSACASTASVACRVGADCASGVCSSDGQCKPADDISEPATGFEPDTSPPDDQDTTPGEDAEAVPDLGPVEPLDVELDPDVVVTTCTPNHDNVIDRVEAPFPLGATVTYLAAEDAAVDLAGTVDDDGMRHWSLEGKLAGDEDMPVTTEPVTSQWFADTFPGASYTARLSVSQPLLGVFETTADALLLRGVVSPDGGTFRTELVFKTPIVVLAFPVRVGDEWSTTSDVEGSAQGITCVGCRERYRNSVDAWGALHTPFGAFPVLRIRVELDRTVAGVTQTTRTFLFVAECFATVGTVVSDPGETAIEFTHAAEVRRITP